MTKAIILDTETTNLPHLGGEACEIAFFEVRPLNHADYRNYIVKLLQEGKQSKDLWDNAYLIEAFHQTFMPKGEFSPRASEVNGFTKEKLIGSPCISTFKFPTDVTYMIGHNIMFDWQMVTKPDVKLICTKELAIKYLTKQSGRGTKGVNTLTGLIERYYPEEAEELIANAHSALQDCKLTYLILLKVLEVAPELDSFEKLAGQCGQPTVKSSLPKGLSQSTEGFISITFGKFHGFSLIHLAKFERNYLTWIVEKSTMPQDLKDFIKQFMIDNR